MNLSPIRRKILSHAFLQADAPASAIAKECGSTEKTVRTAISDLKERGIVRAFPLVNIYALGLTDYCICITLTSDDAKSRREVFMFLKHSPKVAWLAELSGDFHFSVSILARDIFEVADFFDSLSAQIKSISIEKYFALRVNWTSFRCKYFGHGRSRVEKLSRTRPSKILEIDETDHAVLHGLALYPDKSHAGIARLLKMPNATFAHRVRTLKEKGILLGEIYYLDAHRVGMHAFRILIYAKNAGSAITKELFSYASRHRHVSAMIECLGNWDYELNLEVFEPAMVSEITQELYEKFGAQVRMIKAVAVLQTFKTAPYPFLNRQGFD